MSEWKELKVSEIAEVIGGGTPKTVVAEYWNGNIPWITPRDLSGFTKKYISKGERNITLLGIENSNARLLPKGTVLMSSRAPIGYLAIAENPVSTNQGFQSLIPNEKTTTEFLYYLLKKNVDYLISNGSGTTFGELSKSTFKEIIFKIPSLNEQAAIAEVLSSLDDKIDLLHRQNKTLEQLAETLFRQWFVEEAEEQSDNKLLLGDLIESVSITHKFPFETVVFLNTSDIYLGDVLVYEEVDIKSLPGQAKKSIQENDILFSEIRPANGRYAYINFNSENYVVSTKLMVLRSKNILSQAFIYFYLTHKQTVEWLQVIAESRSGTFPQITFEQIKDLKINIPSDIILNNSVKWCEVALEKIKSNSKQIRTLTQLRDTLLPKLMSGEVRIN